jgi:hypothetical protein
LGGLDLVVANAVSGVKRGGGWDGLSGLMSGV